MKKVLIFLLMIPIVFAISSDSPTNNFYTNQNTLNFECSFSGNNYTLLELYTNISGTFSSTKSTTTFSSPHSFTVNSIPDGTYIWGCKLDSDFSQNKTLSIDTTIPTISLIEPSQPNYTTSTQNLDYSVEDVNLDYCNYFLNGEKTTLNSCKNTTFTPKEGENNLTIYVYDKANNSNSDQITFNTPMIAPKILDLDYDYEINGENINLTLTALTDEKAICKYDDKPDPFNMLELFDNTINTTHTTTLTYTNNINETFYYLCKDLLGNLMENHSTLDISIELESNIFIYDDKVVYKVGNVKANDIIKFNLDNLDVLNINLKLNKEVNNVELEYLFVKNEPVSLKTIDGITYYAFELSGLNGEDISSIEVNFKVDKSWLNEKGLPSSKVKLYEFKNNAWIETKITDIKSRSKYYSYKAIPSRLTTYAIIVLGKESKQEPITTNETVEKSIEITSSEDSKEITLNNNKNHGKFLGILLAFTLIFGGFGLYLYNHRKDIYK